MYQPYGSAPTPRPVGPWIPLIGIVAAISAVLIYLLFWAPPSTPGGRPYFGYWGGFLLIFILIWVGFFALRIALWRGYRARYGGGPRGGRARRDPAVMEARQRYARGEITREQFEQIMTDLGRRPRGP